MNDPFLPETSNLLEVSRKGILLIASITKYLSTLPHPIDVVEELVAVCSVTSNLLTTLDTTITRFQPTTSCRASFVNPLCHDILLAFSQFAQKVGEAKRLGVFEINNVGLVRVPINAWAYVMGGEVRMAQFRSRLYVEKYRVRVLIDAVAWHGLRAIGPLGRTAQEERELENLSKMLPLVAERLMGVWRDYKPRIENDGVATAPCLPVQVQEQHTPRVAVAVEGEKKGYFEQEGNPSTSKLGFHASSSSTSIASACSSCSTSSSATATDDALYERWVLRCNEAKRELQSRSHLLGLPVRSRYKHTAANHYVKALSSHPSEIQSLISLQKATNSSIAGAITSLPDDAQWEIQKLTESRENASSNESVKRSFEVVAFQSQPRRKICACPPRSRTWWRSEKNLAPLEWTLVLKGETVDQKRRTTPIKHEDAWNTKKLTDTGIASPAQPMQNSPMISPSQRHLINVVQMAAADNGGNDSTAAPGAHVLRHVEQRRGYDPKEAEAKMVEMLKDLCKVEGVAVTKGETRRAGTPGAST